MHESSFARYRPIIAAASEADIREDVTLDGRLTLAREGRVEVSYAPFEHVVSTAQVIIVGITPGEHQAGQALLEARRQVLAGADDRTALASAKVHAAFSGRMREGLVRMLDHVGLNDRLGVETCSYLWDTHGHLAHFTSALRNPVFVDGENYSGQPSMTRTHLLRGIVEECLAEEARALPNALWVPCGGTAAEGVEWLVRKGVLDPDRVCLGMPHPSPANVERVQYFLGLRDRDSLSAKTNPDLIDRAKAGMIAKVKRLAIPSIPVSGTLPALAIASKLPAPAKTVVASATPTRPAPTSAASTSGLGNEVHDAIRSDGCFVEHRKPTRKIATYRIRSSGLVFAAQIEGVAAITLWLPASDAAKTAVAGEGISVPLVSIPYGNPAKPGDYGRHSNLKAIPELKDATLLAVPVTSAGQALRLLASLDR